MSLLVAITGGIGAGKSYISNILFKYGYKVYDCDSRAKILMTKNKTLKLALIDIFGNDIIDCNGCINRELLASIIFNNRCLFEKLNSLVHPVVIEDIKLWSENNRNENLLFVETAILKESVVDKIVDKVVYVDANEELRINRVMKRNSTDYSSVRKRIQNQSNNSQIADFTIINDGAVPVIPQLESVLGQLKTL